MDRTPSTVARELKRHTSHTQGYAPEYAHLHTASRRWRGSRLERQPGLQQDVLSRLGPWAATEISAALADVDAHVRLHCAQVLERMGPRASSAGPALLRALAEPFWPPPPPKPWGTWQRLILPKAFALCISSWATAMKWCGPSCYVALHATSHRQRSHCFGAPSKIPMGWCGAPPSKPGET